MPASSSRRRAGNPCCEVTGSSLGLLGIDLSSPLVFDWWKVLPHNNNRCVANDIANGEAEEEELKKASVSDSMFLGTSHTVAS